MSVPLWDEDYPSQATLRAEIEVMVDAFVQALLEVVPRAAITSLYRKGSSLKRWDSPIDYVPELSDIDLHILFVGDVAATQYLYSLENSLQVATRTEALFRQRIAASIHLPRLQLVLANTLRQKPEYLPSPPGTLRTLLGSPYAPVTVVPAEARAVARRQLLEHEEYLASLGGSVIDKPGKHVWPALRTMGWHVSPTGPRVLEILGVPYDDAWSLNRTGVAERLADVGQHELAQAYAAFYLSAWENFLDGGASSRGAYAALRSGAEVLSRSTEIARAVDASERS